MTRAEIRWEQMLVAAASASWSFTGAVKAFLARSSCWVACLIGILLSGCAASAQRVEAHQHSWSLPQAETSTSWWATAAKRLLEGESESRTALKPLPRGAESLDARLLLIDQATSTVDLQYYIWRPDGSGHRMAQALWKAAQRGVRVRLLLDDWGDRPDREELGMLAFHPNVEVRLFNPLNSWLPAWAGLLLDLRTAQRRMHNKVMIADSWVAIVGGRNIGDEYFEQQPLLDFGDLDLWLLGPGVQAAARGFDAYWNSRHVVRVLPRQPVDLTSDSAHPVARSDLAQTACDGCALQRLSDGAWTLGEVIFVQDDPDKILDFVDRAGTRGLPGQLAGILGEARQRLLVLSPYLVPGASGIAAFRELRSKGVDITVVTNSLSSTDVVAVHAGYARYRREMLAMGVRLYEIQANPAARSGGRQKSSTSSLHAKLMVLDGRSIYVGSMNLDPRSVRINTENGVVVPDSQLASRLEEGVLQAVTASAYRLQLRDGNLLWTDIQQADPRPLSNEPGASWWRRVQAWLLALLPLESLL